MIRAAPAGAPAAPGTAKLDGSSQQPAYDVMKLQTACTATTRKAVSIHRGTTDPDVCRYPLDGWPNYPRATVTCVSGDNG